MHRLLRVAFPGRVRAENPLHDVESPVLRETGLPGGLPASAKPPLTNWDLAQETSFRCGLAAGARQAPCTPPRCAVVWVEHPECHGARITQHGSAPLWLLSNGRTSTCKFDLCIKKLFTSGRLPSLLCVPLFQGAGRWGAQALPRGPQPPGLGMSPSVLSRSHLLSHGIFNRPGGGPPCSYK